MPDIANNYDLDTELKKWMAVFKEGVSDNFTTHELSVSVGVSVFPAPARSAKKLIEQAIDAVKEAQNTSAALPCFCPHQRNHSIERFSGNFSSSAQTSLFAGSLPVHKYPMYMQYSQADCLLSQLYL